MLFLHNYANISMVDQVEDSAMPVESVKRCAAIVKSGCKVDRYLTEPVVRMKTLTKIEGRKTRRYANLTLLITC